MDIEKLIEQLNDFNENHIAVLCGSGQCACGYLCDKDDCIVVRAATALSTLQAENERLREALKPNCIGCHYIHPDNGNCTAVGGFCTAVPAAHCPLIPELRAELEQVKAERDAAVKVLSKFGCRTCTKYNCFARNGEEDCHWEFYGQKED